MYKVDYEPAAATAAGAVVAVAPAAADPTPLPIDRHGLIRWVGPIIWAATCGAVLYNLRSLSFREVESLIPRSFAFWLLLAAFYMAIPVSEWVIFRRLWKVPAAGFLALLRKFVGNEILLGYIGEVYFYSWARRRATMVGAPFGAIKDVAILSAFTGNVVTLGMVAIVYPFIGFLSLGVHSRPIYISAIVMLVISLAAMPFRRRLFSLPAHELRFVIAVHVARILGSALVLSLMWHIVLPSVAFRWWLLLAALRLLVSRLPLLPNKDFVFAGIAVVLVGHNSEIASLLTMMASLLLTIHIVVGLGLAALEARWGSRENTA
jgi:hypothetical protein